MTSTLSSGKAPASGVALASVRAARDVLAEVASTISPNLMTPAVALDWWVTHDEIERLATSIKTLLAARAAESRAWQEAGFRNPAEHLARLAGTTIGSARDQLATSGRLASLPATEAALRAGDLSARQAGTVADAAAVNPAAEASLLEVAANSSSSDLHQEALRAKAAADEDPDATHRRIHASRYLRTHTDPEGAWNLRARGTTEDGARIQHALEPIIDEIFRDARRRGEPETRDAYAFDALSTLADRSDCDVQPSARPAPNRPTPTFLALLRIDVAALVRGNIEGDELCEITGVGPVRIRVARDLLGDSILKLVITRGTDVANITHLGRGPTTAQRVALLWHSPTCNVQGCGRTRIEIDHRIDWTETHHTRLDELDPLCYHHHNQKHQHGWALINGTGPRPFVPPDDPRHPGQQPPHAEPTTNNHANPETPDRPPP